MESRDPESEQERVTCHVSGVVVRVQTFIHNYHLDTMPPAEQGGGVDAKNRKREGARDILSTKIEENGGDLSDEAEGADVLLYDPKRTNEDLLVIAYGAHSNHRLRDLWLKPVAHIKHSIKRQSFELLPPRRQAMPGRVGHKRVEFSQDDKEHLGQYLASRVPKPADGGLLGKVLYNELVDLYTVDPTEYAWVKRHTAQSWREHYKKNPAYFNAFIIDYVAEYGPNHDRNRYFRTRELNRGIKRSHSDDDDEQDEEEKPEHIPTQNWRGKRAAREEEERRQRSIARRQEAEEDSEEDVAPPARPKNATPGPSGTNRHFSEGMTTLVASPEKTQIITSQTPPGSPVHSPEPKRERSPSSTLRLPLQR
ncbi:hypothetical protein BDZ89DRAFT_484888 [Hymenopellis radicata]|nr:hypothetical protein BDZ89DRAFT_484888 [Hymenopellis radicata]